MSDPAKDQLHQYVLGQLEGPERLAFEEKMSADPSLAEEVAFQRLVVEGLDALVTEELTSKMADWDEVLDQQGGFGQASPEERGPAAGDPGTENPISLWPRMLAAAAAMVLLLLVFGWLRSSHAGEKDAAALAHQALAWAPQESSADYSFVGKGGLPGLWAYFAADTTIDSTAAQELRRQALENLNRAITNALEPAQLDTLHYFAGRCELQLDQPQNSIDHFEFVAGEKSSVYQEDAEWYLGLGELLTNDRRAGEKRMKGIVNKAGHKRKVEAERLLKELEKR